MTRAVARAALLGVLLGAGALMAIAAVCKNPALPAPETDSAVAARATEAWPICTSMASLGENADWAQLDPDFALGLKALSGEDWTGAISMLAPAALRDARNADIQNYLGYAHYRLRQLDAAFEHYRRRSTLGSAARTSIWAKPTWWSAISPRRKSIWQHSSEFVSSPASNMTA